MMLSANELKCFSKNDDFLYQSPAGPITVRDLILRLRFSICPVPVHEAGVKKPEGIPYRKKGSVSLFGTCTEIFFKEWIRKNMV